MERWNLTGGGGGGGGNWYWWNNHKKYGNGNICSVGMFLGQLASWPRLPFNMHVPVALFLCFMFHERLTKPCLFFPKLQSDHHVILCFDRWNAQSFWIWFNIQMIVICLLDFSQFVSSVNVCVIWRFYSEAPCCSIAFVLSSDSYEESMDGALSGKVLLFFWLGLKFY